MPTNKVIFDNIGGEAIVAVGSTNKAKLEWVCSKFLFKGKADLQAFTDKIPLGKMPVGVFLDRVCMFEVGKLVRRPEGLMNL